MLRRGSFFARCVAAALACAVAAGCAGLPQDGVVQAGGTAVPEPDPILFVGDAPSQGDVPEEIVLGFLDSATSGLSGEVDFAVARSYLTASANVSWEPLAEVLVTSASSAMTVDVAPEPTASPTGSAPTDSPSEDPEAHSTSSIDAANRASATLSVDVVASVDSSGVYQAAGSPAPAEITFDLRRVDGEWRIDRLPPGIVLSEVTFGLLYRQAPVYFWTPDGQALVPDVRSVPHRNAAASIVTALLDGPVAWLAPAVTTAAPDGTRLDVESSLVVTSDGVAQVELSEEARAATSEERQSLYVQLFATLTAAPSTPTIRSVELTIGGAPYSPSATLPDPLVDPYVGQALTLVSDDRVQLLASRSLVPLDDVAALDGVDVTALATPFGSLAPIVLREGSAVLRSAATTTEPGEVVARGEELTAPSYDRHGWLWFSERESGGRVSALSPQGELVGVEAAWLDGVDVIGVRVSREGARVAVLTRVGDVARLRVAAVLRDGAGAPVRLGEGVAVGYALIEGVALAWVNEETVAVLGRGEADDEPAVRLVSVAGPTQALTPLAGAVSLAAGDGGSEIYVGTADGRLWAREGLRWVTVVEEARAPAFPG